MDRTYWHKQTAEQPLFPDLLWSRPEHRAQAGKLLIVGGNAHGFAAAGEAYAAAEAVGVGTARVLLPDSLQKTVGKVLADGEYAPSTPSGSFARQALAEFLALGEWSDATVLAGDLGRNPETAIVLEQFATDYHGRLTITKDAADYFTHTARIIDRSKTLLVLSFAQLQKLAITARFSRPLTFDMDLLRLVEALHDFTTSHKVAIITKHLETIFVAASGEVSTTKRVADQEIWRVKTATQATVWWLQNPAKAFESFTSALV